MSSWSTEDLARFERAGTIDIAPLRADGRTLRRPTPVWVAVVDGAPHVLAGGGEGTAWFRAGVAQGAGQVTVEGTTYDVAFERTDQERGADVVAAFDRKYARSGYFNHARVHRSPHVGLRVTPR